VKSLKNLIALQEVTLLFSSDYRETTITDQVKILKTLRKHISLKKASINFGQSVQTLDIENERISREKREGSQFVKLVE